MNCPWFWLITCRIRFLKAKTNEMHNVSDVTVAVETMKLCVSKNTNMDENKKSKIDDKEFNISPDINMIINLAIYTKNVERKTYM